MKTIRRCFLVLAFLAVSTVASGSPFLVSDSYPAGGPKPEKFLVTIGGKTTKSKPAKNANGSVYLKYDLGGLPDGTYMATITAVDVKGTESPPAFCSFKKTGLKVEIVATPPKGIVATSAPEEVVTPSPKEKRPPTRDAPTYKDYPGYINH